MAEFTSHTPGTFSWPELATTDQKAGVTFYRALFGLYEAFPLWASLRWLGNPVGQLAHGDIAAWLTTSALPEGNP